MLMLPLPGPEWRDNRYAMSLLERYEAGLRQGEYQSDEAQRVLLHLLHRLGQKLSGSPPGGFLARILARIFRRVKPAPPVRGLYCWGGVGRGKTFLMDIFYDSLPFRKKRRLHFYRFMREVHQGLRDFQGEANPLKLVAADIAREARVLCLDEFFVNDITDAMLLAGLLEEMFALGITLVVTSNVEPDRLYENGLQRSKFLPAIKLLKQHTHVHRMEAGVDYRLRVLESAGIYHCPLDEAAEAALEAAFFSISPDTVADKSPQAQQSQSQLQSKSAGRFPENRLMIEGREIPTRLCGDGVVWFDFSALCDGPRSQNDYIELARLFQTVLIGGVPRFTEGKDEQARRFISLVDEFYDRNVKVILSAEAAIPELYQGQRLAVEFQRTESRLQEMQSRDYLAGEHRP